MKKYLYPANILIPKKDFDKWAVIACDQYTSDKKYWNKVEEIVGDANSTLRLTLPEIYLSETEERIGKINATMDEYLNSDVFDVLENSMVYIEREITGGGLRQGLLGLIDLNEYEYEAGKGGLIRATEQTVTERIPPRVKIRKDAPLEFPHVLLFIDDPDNSVMSALGDKAQYNKLYDFDLMQNGGHIEGYKLNEGVQEKINAELAQLVKDGLLFAVGDGNHSLATAKECSKINKSELAKFALAEVVNIHNPAIEFEPIYRVLFGVNKAKLTEYLLSKNASAKGEEKHNFIVIDNETETNLELTATSKLPVGTIQAYLDDFLKLNPEVEIDYIHGTDAVRELCKEENTVGFIFDGMKKDELFEAVIQDGSLPRKTFSMGHADDKRFYIEGRKIK
ncbi:MAG: DUF1015 domain-containing protein [Clostridia bacterium]|nr:DUF1015 domain-containing protein [Clostridia bacterium]